MRHAGVRRRNHGWKLERNGRRSACFPLPPLSMFFRHCSTFCFIHFFHIPLLPLLNSVMRSGRAKLPAGSWCSAIAQGFWYMDGVHFGMRSTTYVYICRVYCSAKNDSQWQKLERTEYTWSSRFPKLEGTRPTVPLGGCAYGEVPVCACRRKRKTISGRGRVLHCRTATDFDPPKRDNCGRWRQTSPVHITPTQLN